jgi:hypothetical protein
VEFLKRFPEQRHVLATAETLAERLVRIYRICSSEDWNWFETSLTYANARIPQSLLLLSELTSDRELRDIGRSSLGWLMSQQTLNHNLFAPIGCEFAFMEGGPRPYCDQQPVEAWASLSACFHGENTLGLNLYDKRFGGCRDGLHPERINENQGAESTIAYLCSQVEMQKSYTPASPIWLR